MQQGAGLDGDPEAVDGGLELEGKAEEDKSGKLIICVLVMEQRVVLFAPIASPLGAKIGKALSSQQD